MRGGKGGKAGGVGRLLKLLGREDPKEGESSMGRSPKLELGNSGTADTPEFCSGRRFCSLGFNSITGTLISPDSETSGSEVGKLVT